MAGTVGADDDRFASLSLLLAARRSRPSRDLSADLLSSRSRPRLDERRRWLRCLPWLPLEDDRERRDLERDLERDRERLRLLEDEDRD